ncbi:unnamed protein product [Heterobilharzia americana]|nr:unnamed protein product [Heterobilharzia americana]
MENSNLKCSINIFKTKEFLVPVHRKPSKLQINIGFMHLNNQKQHEMNISLLSIYEINRKQIRNITTVFTFSIPHEEIHFSLDNQLDWKLSAFGALTKFDSLTKIQLLPMNQSVKLMLMYSSEEQLLSYVLMQYDDPHFQNVYSLKSWLQPWRNLYEFTFQWPKLHTVHVLTIYDFTPVDVYTGLTVDHLVYFNHIKYLKIKNQLMYKLDEHKLLILHQTEALNATNNATNNISDNTNNDISEMKNTRLISKFELIFQLYPEMKFTPFHIKFIGAAKIHLFLPTYKINKESEGKLKIDVTKFKGESILKLFDIQLYNQSKFLIEWSSNFKFSHKWLFNTNLKLITQSGEENNLTFSWKSLNKSTFVVLNCLILSLGNFVCHYKHRWDTIYHFGGSNMISIQSYVPNEWLSGFYLNANYALNLNSNQKLIEISAEYSTSNSMGPGSPVRARVFFKHGEMYEFGNLEFGLDSQLMGHHFGYEMVNAMAEYEFSPPHSENQIRFISRAIAGYRLYEGRGTKGYQGELFIVQNKEDNKLNILLRFGRPGLIHQNKFEYSQTLEKMYANLQISTVFSGKSYLEGKVKLQHDKTSSIPTFSNITMFSPCLPLMFNFYYHLERNISVLVINENLLISINRSSNPFYLNQTFEFKNKSIKPLNIYHDMRFQCDTNKGENHLASLSYTSKQSDKEIHKNFQLNGTLQYTHWLCSVIPVMNSVYITTLSISYGTM